MKWLPLAGMVLLPPAKVATVAFGIAQIPTTAGQELWMISATLLPFLPTQTTEAIKLSECVLR